MYSATASSSRLILKLYRVSRWQHNTHKQCVKAYCVCRHGAIHFKHDSKGRERHERAHEQAARPGRTRRTRHRHARARQKRPRHNWREIDYVQPTEAESENALYGWAKYRVVARKPTDAETADCIGETFAEAANEF